MTGDHLDVILKNAQAKSEKDGFSSLPEGATLTFYVAHDGAMLTVSRIDPNTMREDGDQIRVGTSPTWITSAAGSIWVSNQSDGTVSRIDEKTGKTVGSPVRIAAPADDAAAHVMSAAGDSLWVASATEHTLSRINPSS